MTNVAKQVIKHSNALLKTVMTVIRNEKIKQGENSTALVTIVERVDIRLKIAWN